MVLTGRQLSLALAYVRAGFAVIPIEPGRYEWEAPSGARPAGRPVSRGKNPLIPGGAHAGIRNETAVYKWWGKYPDAWVGLPCGANNLLVADSHPGRPIRALERPDVLKARTPRGWHYFFRAEKAAKAPAGKPLGAECWRGDGHYVVAPGNPSGEWACAQPAEDYGYQPDGYSFEGMSGSPAAVLAGVAPMPADLSALLAELDRGHERTQGAEKRRIADRWYERAISAEEVLERNGWGWNSHDRYWYHPESTSRTTARVSGPNNGYCGGEVQEGNLWVYDAGHTEPFEPGQSYTPLAVCARLEHGDDFGAAREALTVEFADREHGGDLDAARAALGLDEDRPAVLPGGPAKGNSQANLIALARELYDFGIDLQGEPFAVAKDGPRWAFPLDGDRFAGTLRRRYFERHGRTVAAQAVSGAVSLLGDYARDEEPQRVNVRVARTETGSVVLDLGDRTGRAVIVNAGTWRVVDQSPVIFRRTNETGALPEPQRGGQLDELRRVLNVSGESWPLVVGLLVAGFLADIPHPIGAITGVQGTTKTWTAKTLKAMIDPSPAAEPTGAVKSADDWAALGASSYVIVLDNLSTIPRWLSDLLCAACTGTSIKARRLYKQGESKIISFRAVVLLTGIGFTNLRGDLADRLVPIELVKKETYRTERDALREFEDIWPRALGGLLDLVAAVLRELPSVVVEVRHRLSDYAFVLAAMDRVTGGDSLGAFMAARQAADLDVALGDPFVAAIRRLVAHADGSPIGGGTWEGSYEELRLALVEDAESGIDARRVPASAAGVREAIKRNAQSLPAAGLQVEVTGSQSHKRVIVGLIDAPPANQECARCGDSSADTCGRADCPRSAA